MYPRDDFRALLAPITVDGEPVVGAEASRRFRPWLAAHGAPELARWNAAIAAVGVRGGYRNPLFAAHVETCSAAIAQPDDGCRAARIRSLFLGASPILEDAEELWLARWVPDADGNSEVWASHQDERDLWKASDSIADFVIKQYREDSYFTGDDPARRVAWPDAWGEPVESETSPSSVEGVSFDALQARTDWIVALWFPEGDWYGLGDGLDGAPAFAQFVDEAAAIAQWPHLQAYWLWHHLVFDNRVALAALLPTIERSYAPSDELAALAERVLAGEAIDSPLWDEVAIRGLRDSARGGAPQVFEPGAHGAEQDAVAVALDETIARERAALEESPAMQAWQLLGQGAGRLDEHEAQGIRTMVTDADEQIAVLLRAKRGEAPLLGLALQALAADVDAAWLPLATAELARSAAFDEDHARHHPGTLTAFVVATGDWAAALARVVEVLGPVASLGRWRRLALAAAAERLHETAFLVEEARRYAAQLPSSATDTSSFALDRLLARRDAQVIALVVDAVATARSRGLQSLLAPIHAAPDAAFAPILAAVVRRRYGTHADGEPVAMAVTLGRCDAALARATLVEVFPDGAAPRDRATRIAGLLAADPRDAAAQTEAHALLEVLDASQEAEGGAGVALLRAIRALEVPGFDEVLAAWKARPRSKHIGASLKRWIESA